MSYARPIINTRKRHLVASPGNFKDLEGKTLPHKRGGSWKVGPLYVIRDKRAKTGHSTWANMMYIATCTRCEIAQHIEARAIKNGTGCKHCREADKRESEARRKADALLQADLKARLIAEEWKAIDHQLPALISAGLSAKQIGRALGIKHGSVVSRLRVLKLKTAHPKVSKGQVFTLDGKLAATKRERKAASEARLAERRRTNRIASRIARGMPAHLAHAERKLKTGPKGPRLSPEDRDIRHRESKRRQRRAIKDDPIRLEAQRLAARRYQRLKRGLDPDAPLMKRGRRSAEG